MNKQRRNRIAEALELISQARDILEEVKDEEQEKLRKSAGEFAIWRTWRADAGKRKELGLMKPLEPDQTAQYKFSDLQMSLYYTIYI